MSRSLTKFENRKSVEKNVENRNFDAALIATFRNFYEKVDLLLKFSLYITKTSEMLQYPKTAELYD